MKKEYLNEIWKPIKGYEGLYEVSNFGRIKSLKFGKERIIKGSKDKYGYLQVGLSKNNKSKTFKVHRLVAEAFIDNTDNLPQVNHKDENPSNNVVSNLEWCDAKYNCNYGSHREKQINSQQKRKILQYDLEGNLIKEWVSINECDRNGFDKGAVWRCCNGFHKQRYNSIWKYKE